MTLANRWTRAPHGDPPQLVIDLDPHEIERKKAQRLYRLNVVQIPTLRILGFFLLTVCIFFHNLFIFESSSHPTNSYHSISCDELFFNLLVDSLSLL